MMEILVTDTHIHLTDSNMVEYNWSKEYPDWTKFSEAEYLADWQTSMSMFTRSKGVFIEVDACDPIKEFDWISNQTAMTTAQDSSTSTSLIGGIVASVPLELGPDATAQHIKRIQNGTGTLVGIRRLLQQEPIGDRPIYLQPHFLESLAYLGSASVGLPFDICAVHQQLPTINKMVASTPANIYILDHLGKPFHGQEDFAQWSLNIKQFSEYPNTYCKLSPGFISNAQEQDWRPYIDYAVKCFGVGRLMVGSDWFFSKSVFKPTEWFQELYNQFHTALNKEEIISVFNDNARLVYELK